MPPKDWKNLPDRSTPVTAEVIEGWEAVLDVAARVVGGVLVDPAGDPIEVGGEVTADAINTALEGADALDLPAGTTIGDAVPGLYTFDETAQTVTFATDNGTITLTGVYAPGDVEPPPPADYESLVVLRYGPPIPTSATANLWAATKPSSGGPIIQWAADPGGTESSYKADAFATGVHGWEFGSDVTTLTLPTSQTPNPGVGRGLYATSMRNLMIPTGATSQWVVRFKAGLVDRFAIIWDIDGTWRFDGATGTNTAGTQTLATYGGNPAITEKMVLAVVMKGATSELRIGTAGETQVIPFDASAVGAYDTIDLSPFSSGTVTGARTQHKLIWGPSGFTAEQVDAAMDDLAADISLTLGA